MGFSRHEYWNGLPFPSPVDHILSELSTMTRPSWVALHGMAHCFTELDKAVVHVLKLVSFLWWWFSVCLPSDGEGLSEVSQSCPTLCNPMDCTCQVPPSVGFSRQDYWSGLLFPPEDRPDSGIKPGYPALQADSLSSEPQENHKRRIRGLWKLTDGIDWLRGDTWSCSDGWGHVNL